MNILLWRHAEAQDSWPDLERALTPHGLKQAEDTARWLKPRLPKNCVVRVSPALRARQTAQALQLPVEIDPELAPGEGPESYLKALGWPQAQHSDSCVMLVGHQPTLGVVAAHLLHGREQYLAIRKSGLWWFTSRDREEGASIVLRAVINPDLL